MGIKLHVRELRNDYKWVIIEFVNIHTILALQCNMYWMILYQHEDNTKYKCTQVRGKK